LVFDDKKPPQVHSQAEVFYLVENYAVTVFLASCRLKRPTASRQWQITFVYHTVRNAVFGFNGIIKDKLLQLAEWVAFCCVGMI